MNPTQTIPLACADGEIRLVTKIAPEHFSDLHETVLENLQYTDGSLVLNQENWRAWYLGAGEEKAVYGLCDPDNHIFALEIINERTYLNGRLIGGDYFFERHVDGLAQISPNPDAIQPFTFTGLVKVREYIYGYTWDCFQFDARRKSWLDRVLTAFLQGYFAGQFQDFQTRYQDIHDRNVVFEIHPWGAFGCPIIYRDCSGQLRLGSVTLRGIDLR